MRFLAEPADVNYGGKVHGGAVMKWIETVARYRQPLPPDPAS